MKKRSELLKPPYVFFVDRCLGKGFVPEALKECLIEGERVETHDQHYPPNTRDVEWLQAVGAKRWVVLSQDQNITRNPLEQKALLDARVAFFGLSRGDAPGRDKAVSLASAVDGIRRALRRFEVPLIATVSRDGDVTIKWADGIRMKKPMRIAVRRQK